MNEDEPTTTTATTAEPAAQDQPTTKETTAAKQTPRRRRAASRPAGPPQAVPENATEGTDPSAAEPASSATEATEPPDGATPPRRRSTRTRRTPASSNTPTGTDTPAAEDSSTDAQAAAPTEAETKTEGSTTTARATTRRRRTRTSPTPAVAADSEAATAEATTDTSQEPAAEKPAAQSMPLFQAPDLSAAPPRRRRAATRPAGPPQLGDSEEREQDAPEGDNGADTDESGDHSADVGDESVEDTDQENGSRRRRRRRGGRGRRGRAKDGDDQGTEDDPDADSEDGTTGQDQDGEEDTDTETTASTGSGGNSRRRRRRRRRSTSSDTEPGPDDPPNTVVKVRDGRRSGKDDVEGVRGSTRLEAKKMRRREGREAGRRKSVITESEFLARRESVERTMVVRELDGRTQIGVLEDGVLVEHYVARRTQTSMVGNVYLGRVQNVLPSMEAAFIDVGKGRNAVLYAGEVNWDAAGMKGQPKRIENALKSGESVLVQVTKDPIGHKGARLTSQVSLPGRYLVYVPGGSMTGISRKLPDTERSRLKKILRSVVPEDAGVIVRTAAEGASEDELRRDVARLTAQWEDIAAKAESVNAPALLYGEPDLAIKVVRDIFNEDFAELIVSGADVWDTLRDYLGYVAPDLIERMRRWDEEKDVFAAHRIDEQLAKALERKVWLPSGGSLVIDRTEAMTVIDVNTGKFTGSGGNLEETVTKNNLEAAEEIVRQLRLRDVGGIIVIDFIDMVLESNRELVLRRLLETLGRDRTKHQVAEVTSLGLVQMTRKRVGQGLLEVFSETCEVCGGRGVLLHSEPVEKRQQGQPEQAKPARSSRSRGSRGNKSQDTASGEAPAEPGSSTDGKPPAEEGTGGSGAPAQVEATEPESVPQG
jgi:ribonuclease E